MSLLRRLAPLAPWNLLHTLDEVRQIRTKSTEVHRQARVLTKQTKALTTEMEDNRQTLAKLGTLVNQSRTAYQSDATRPSARLDRGLKRISDATTASHVRAAVAAAPLESDPCPYIVLEQLLPDDAYDELVAAIPPPLFFEHLASHRQDLKVPFPFAPRYHREFWLAFRTRIVANSLIPALSDKFQPGLDAWVRTNWPGVDSMGDAGISLHPLASRIMRRRPGYEIKPHHDPKWAFMTCILYLTRRDDVQLYGTQLCRLRHERESPSHSPLWVDENDVETVKEVPGRSNSALAFLNSTGVHRASIPADAPPETDRYIFQLQLGPEQSVRDSLVKRLPAEQAHRWNTKNVNRTFKY
jgi:hypothetical protein